MNLLKETMVAMGDSDLRYEDIIYIGSEHSGRQCSWEEFCILANTCYDNSYGMREVARDLIIVFKDGTVMRRREYDGAEWWEVTKKFKKPKNKLPIKSLFINHAVCAETLDEINESLT